MIAVLLSRNSRCSSSWLVETKAAEHMENSGYAQLAALMLSVLRLKQRNSTDDKV